jgi:amino acid transporter
MNRARPGAVEARRLRRSLTTLPLVFVMFFNVSGGAYTLEGLVAAIGPGLALATLALVPLVWSLPEVLLIGELASMLPEEGGYYRWVQRAFGPFWAFQCGWCTWMYSMVDMAIYPVLVNQYLASFVPGLGGVARYLVSLAVIWLAVAVNLRGTLDVGRTSVAIGLVVLLGFFGLALAALPHQAHVPWLPFATPGESTFGGLGVGISIALWNYTGWDNASTVQGEVVDASRTYPRALAFALPLVALAYFVPLVPALGATDWTTWSEGGWPEIARAAAGGGAIGSVLAVWIALAGIASALALFNALLMAYSRIPLAMASDGLLPRALATIDARGTPRNAVLASAVCYSLCALFTFQELVVADVLLYALALFLEFGSLLALRRREPMLRGAFRLPLGLPGLTALVALPVGFFGLAVGLSLQDGEYGAPAVAAAFGVAALGPFAYGAASLGRRRGLR